MRSLVRQEAILWDKVHVWWNYGKFIHAREAKNREIEESDLLQWKLRSALFWQIPFHFDGIGPISSSLKLCDSGHTPGSLPNGECEGKETQRSWSQKMKQNISWTFFSTSLISLSLTKTTVYMLILINLRQPNVISNFFFLFYFLPWWCCSLT